MAYRKFVDENGAWWQVWDVRPSDAERRLRERRMIHAPPDGEDKRTLIDRRRPMSPLTTVPSDLANGWLAFHSLSQKRRYWPIPPGWEELTDSELRVLCSEAHTVASRVPPAFDTGEHGGPAPPAEPRH
jgi:hypothetical protein